MKVVGSGTATTVLLDAKPSKKLMPPTPASPNGPIRLAAPVVSSIEKRLLLAVPYRIPARATPATAIVAPNRNAKIAFFKATHPFSLLGPGHPPMMEGQALNQL